MIVMANFMVFFFFLLEFFFIEFIDLFTFLFQEKDAKHIPLQVINNALRKGTDSHGMTTL